MSTAVETTRSLGMEVTGMERLLLLQCVEESLFFHNGKWPHIGCNENADVFRYCLGSGTRLWKLTCKGICAVDSVMPATALSIMY